MGLRNFNETDWEMLLAFIQEETVIPIVGSGLSRVKCPDSGRTILFDKWLANSLAAKLSLPGEHASLNEVVEAVLAGGGNIRGLYPVIRNLVLSAPFEPPEALANLASIEAFRLLISTTFDGLLARAVGMADQGRMPLEFAYSPRQFDDIPAPLATLAQRSVYYLLGKVAATARYAISEEDLLEWITALQSETHSPERLVSEMQNHHLLVLGVEYPDWLGRFFVRTAKRRRLSEERDWFEFLVHPDTSPESSMTRFFQKISRNIRIIGHCSSPEDFVEELAERWRAGGSLPMAEVRPKLVRFIPPPKVMDPRSIFISYSRGDLDAVKQLKSALDEAKIPSWFDLEQIGTGDDYRQLIQKNIQTCAYFMPIISTGALARDEAFFYREWAWARDRQLGMGPGSVFILPVIVDDTPLQHPRLTEFSSNLDIARLAGGIAGPDFLARLSRLFNPGSVQTR